MIGRLLVLVCFHSVGYNVHAKHLVSSECVKQFTHTSSNLQKLPARILRMTTSYSPNDYIGLQRK